MRLAGDTTVTELRPERRYTEAGGWLKVRVWEGFQSDLEAFAVALQADGYADITISPDGDGPGTGRLSATINKIDEGATDDPDFDVWELQINDVEVSPDRSAYFTDSTKNPHTATLSDDMLTRVKSDVTAGTPFSFTPLAVTAAQISLGQDLYELLSKGQNKLEDQLVMRLTKTISSTSATAVSPNNILRRILASAIVSTESIPAFDAAAMDLPSTGEWLKKQPQRVKVARGQWQITQEWWYDPLGFDYRLYPQIDGTYTAY
jgi:hypothetical protein